MKNVTDHLKGQTAMISVIRGTFCLLANKCLVNVYSHENEVIKNGRSGASSTLVSQ